MNTHPECLSVDQDSPPNPENLRLLAQTGIPIFTQELLAIILAQTDLSLLSDVSLADTNLQDLNPNKPLDGITQKTAEKLILFLLGFCRPPEFVTAHRTTITSDDDILRI